MRATECSPHPLKIAWIEKILPVLRYDASPLPHLPPIVSVCAQIFFHPSFSPSCSCSYNSLLASNKWREGEIAIDAKLGFLVLRLGTPKSGWFLSPSNSAGTRSSGRALLARVLWRNLVPLALLSSFGVSARVADEGVWLRLSYVLRSSLLSSFDCDFSPLAFRFSSCEMDAIWVKFFAIPHSSWLCSPPGFFLSAISARSSIIADRSSLTDLC